MKILYGVQGTGNGHITRARAMQSALVSQGVEVDWVFSGRKREDLFDMEVFGDFQLYKGLSFATRNGKVDLLKTFAESSVGQILHDTGRLGLSQYDLVITDFEPVVAWAARKHGIPCIGIGHQYAFEHSIPKAGHSFASDAVMRWFAPADLGIGVHWHHFGYPILPPIIEPELHNTKAAPNRTLVYLPFEHSASVLAVLRQCDHNFVYHCRDIAPGHYGNVTVRGFSRSGFRHSLHTTNGVICSAGFELASEALSLGRRIMVKPLQGQMEQASNALALSELGLGLATSTIDVASVHRFLASTVPGPLNYPDVPLRLAKWLMQYPDQPLSALVDACWAEVQLPSVPAKVRRKPSYSA